MQYLNWGAKKTEKMIPPNAFPLVHGLEQKGKTTYTACYPINE